MRLAKNITFATLSRRASGLRLPSARGFFRRVGIYRKTGISWEEPNTADGADSTVIPRAVLPSPGPDGIFRANRKP